LVSQSSSSKLQPDTPQQELLKITDLRVSFFVEGTELKAVDGVTYSVGSGETLGVVGESAAGKSVTARSILQLIKPPGRIVGGEVMFQGRNLLHLSDAEMRSEIRGKEISMIFQDPMTSLNPIMKVGQQLTRVIQLHTDLNEDDAYVRAEELLTEVGIPDPRKRLENFPFEMSGGMCQRVLIALALSCNPALLIADEPTTALDVTIQAQILDLLEGLQKSHGTSIIFISHDLGLVGEFCDQIVVMYAGRVVEQAPVEDIIDNPLHPYTEGLVKVMPRLDGERTHRLPTIEGRMPDLYSLPTGCSFHPRCPKATETCRAEQPALVGIGRRQVACHLVDQGVE